MERVSADSIARLHAAAVAAEPEICLACAATIKTPGTFPPVNQIPPGPVVGTAPVLSTRTRMGDGSAPGAMVKVITPWPTGEPGTVSAVVVMVAFTPGYTPLNRTAANNWAPVVHREGFLPW